MLPYRVNGPIGKVWSAAAQAIANRTSTSARARLERDDFTVVCANCWAAEIYRHLKIPYRTPFVGMFIEAPCYMRMLDDLPGYLSAELEWTDRSRYERVNADRAAHGRTYPIGVLRGDAEVHFLHYRTAEEAGERWRRRVERINWDNLLVSLVEYGPPEREAAAAYDALPYERKVLLTPESRPKLACAWRVRGTYDNAVSLYYQGLPQFDVVAWLNDGTLRRPRSLLRRR